MKKKKVISEEERKYVKLTRADKDRIRKARDRDVRKKYGPGNRNRVLTAVCLEAAEYDPEQALILAIDYVDKFEELMAG